MVEILAGDGYAWSEEVRSKDVTAVLMSTMMVETLAEDGGAVLMSTLAGHRMMVLQLKVWNVKQPLHGLKIWEKKQVEICVGLTKAARSRYDGGTLSPNSRTNACLDSPV
ncbi:hypothetical protein ACLOJK_033429 [Asimina triloba]